MSDVVILAAIGVSGFVVTVILVLAHMTWMANAERRAPERDVANDARAVRAVLVEQLGIEGFREACSHYVNALTEQQLAKLCYFVLLHYKSRFGLELTGGKGVKPGRKARTATARAGRHGKSPVDAGKDTAASGN